MRLLNVSLQKIEHTALLVKTLSARKRREEKSNKIVPYPTKSMFKIALNPQVVRIFIKVRLFKTKLWTFLKWENYPRTITLMPVAVSFRIKCLKFKVFHDESDFKNQGSAATNTKKVHSWKELKITIYLHFEYIVILVVITENMNFSQDFITLCKT